LVTLTLKVQLRVLDSASVAVHCTVVVPTGNNEPAVRVHATCTGCTPPDVKGEVKLTPTGFPFADAAVWLPGQVIERATGAGGDGGLGVGVVGGAGGAHAASVIANRTSALRRLNRFDRRIGNWKIVLGAISWQEIRSNRG
jgi:hypothetical protein